jgi:hypothetical protein
MKTLLKLTALAEAATGLTLLAYPPIVVRVLFTADVTGAGILVSRIAGIALLSLGVACWPSGTPGQPAYGMLTYSVVVTLYLVMAGAGGGAGLLLWPAVLVHSMLERYFLSGSYAAPSY